MTETELSFIELHWVCEAIRDQIERTEELPGYLKPPLHPEQPWLPEKIKKEITDEVDHLKSAQAKLYVELLGEEFVR